MTENINSNQIVYSEHDYDECFEYINGSGRVPDGNAVGYEIESNAPKAIIILFSDITYSKYDHGYWNNLELENDPDRLILP
jgi:hypothetical protein|tara:strand:+ start:443 stop:685 length:243 start_codon:yes stop_codon:yes gene_type:complete